MNRIHIFLLGTDREPFVVEREPSDQVGSLVQDLRPIDSGRRGGYCFFYSGVALIPMLSFSFYNMAEGAQIVYAEVTEMSAERRPSKPKSYKTLTGDAATCFKIAMGFHPDSDTDLVFENSRLKDVIFQKVEGNLMFHRRLISKYNEIQEEHETKEAQTTVMDSSRLSNPSTKGLPVPWAVGHS